MSCSGGRPPEATCQSRRFPSPYPLLLPATREFHPPTHPGAPKIFSFWPRQLNITFEHSFLFLRDPALPFRVTCQFALEPFAAPLTRDDVCARRLFSGTCENATTSLLPALDSSRSPARPHPRLQTAAFTFKLAWAAGGCSLRFARRELPADGRGGAGRFSFARAHLRKSNLHQTPNRELN